MAQSTCASGAKRGKNSQPSAMEFSGVPIVRSRQGCVTCRQRRVKCDEMHPRCGQCTRLSRECDWTRKWKFENCNSRVHHDYNKTGLTSSDAMEISSRRWEEMIRGRYESGSSLDELSDGNNEQKTLMHPPGTFNLVFASSDACTILQEHGSALMQSPSSRWTRDQKSMHQSRRSPKSSQNKISKTLPQTRLSPSIRSKPKTQNDPSTFIISEEDSEESSDLLDVQSYSTSSRDSSPTEAYSPFEPWPPLLNIAELYLDSGSRLNDEYKHVLHWERVVAARLMPFAVNHKINIGPDGRDLIATAAEGFPPLHHAICAITLMSSALRGKPNLLLGAFRHYQEAISASLTCLPELNSYRSFYLNTILFLYDLCCATMEWPHDRQVAGQHMQHIFNTFHNQPQSAHSQLVSHCSWGLLFLDAQTCLGGDEEAGWYVRAFRENGYFVPPPPQDPSSHLTPSGMASAIRNLRMRMIQYTAELVPVARAMQKKVSENGVPGEKLQDQIRELGAKLRTEWSAACPQILESCDGMAVLSNMDPDVQRLVLSSFEVAKLQYSALTIYIHTSMYSNQRLHSDRYQEEDAYHCSRILSLVSTGIANHNREHYHTAAVFLAGVTSKAMKERAQAMEVLDVLSPLLPECLLNNTRALLDLIQEKQIRAEMSWSRAEEVDWRDEVRNLGKKIYQFFFFI